MPPSEERAHTFMVRRGKRRGVIFLSARRPAGSNGACAPERLHAVKKIIKENQCAVKQPQSETAVSGRFFSRITALGFQQRTHGIDRCLDRRGIQSDAVP